MIWGPATPVQQSKKFLDLDEIRAKCCKNNLEKACKSLQTESENDVAKRILLQTEFYRVHIKVELICLVFETKGALKWDQWESIRLAIFIGYAENIPLGTA